jgi:hypothetical protein
MARTITPGRLSKSEARKAAAIALQEEQAELDAELDFTYSLETQVPEAEDLANLLLDMRALMFADQANDLSDDYRRLLVHLRQEARAANPPTEPGMYRKDGVIYRVQAAKESGRLYAKKLDGMSFSYASGVIFSLTADDRMTLEEAKAVGHETGVCCVCAALLTDPKSIMAGIGPICAKKV